MRSVLNLLSSLAQRPPVGLSALFVFVSLCSTDSVSGGLIVTAGSTKAWTDSTNNAVEVTLTNSGPADVDLSAFTVGLSVSPAGVTLLDVTNATTTADYVFLGNSLFGPSLVDPSAFPLGSSVIFSDLYAIPAGFVTLTSGETVGLGVLWFNAGGAQGEIKIVIDPLTTSFANGSSTVPDSDIQTVDGKIQVVPEPSTLVLAMLAAGGLGWGAARRAVRRPRSPAA